MAPKLFLDADGVLANFDEGVLRLLGTDHDSFVEERGRGAFWRELAKAPDFYAHLPLMPDGRILFDAVAHLRPTILTGLPLGKWAAPQKVAWAAEHFPKVPIITCMARDKHRYMEPGDVLVDDRDNHRDAYEGHGVVFIHHQSARDSIRRLAAIYPSIKADA